MGYFLSEQLEDNDIRRNNFQVKSSDELHAELPVTG